MRERACHLHGVVEEAAVRLGMSAPFRRGDERDVVVQVRAGDAAVLDVLDAVRDDPDFAHLGQRRAQRLRAVDEDDRIGQRVEVDPAGRLRIEVEAGRVEGLPEPLHFQHVLGDRAELEAPPQRRIDGLVAFEQPIRQCGQAQRAQRAVEGKAFGCLEVEQGIVEVEQEESVFHRTKAARRTRTGRAWGNRQHTSRRARRRAPARPATARDRQMRWPGWAAGSSSWRRGR